MGLASPASKARCWQVLDGACEHRRSCRRSGECRLASLCPACRSGCGPLPKLQALRTPKLTLANPLGSAPSAAQQHNLEHEILSPAQVAQRFPAYRLPEGFQSLFEAGAGFLAPEKCIEAHLGQAQQSGAQLVCGVAVQRWAVEPPAGASSSGGGSDTEGLVRVETSQGTFQARKLVLAAGGWMPQLVPELKVGRLLCLSAAAAGRVMRILWWCSCDIPPADRLGVDISLLAGRTPAGCNSPQALLLMCS